MDEENLKNTEEEVKFVKTPEEAKKEITAIMSSGNSLVDVMMGVQIMAYYQWLTSEDSPPLSELMKKAKAATSKEPAKGSVATGL
jgi:hypothetical protein